jgi:hypothetical protein
VERAAGCGGSARLRRGGGRARGFVWGLLFTLWFPISLRNLLAAPSAETEERGLRAQVARLVDEAAHLGLFERIYPAANHHNYDKYWLHPTGPTAAQRLTGWWATGELEAAGAGDAGGWVADLERDDPEYTAMGLRPVSAGNPMPISTLSPRPTPAPPLGTAQPPPILTPTIVLHEQRESYEVLRQQLQTRADEIRRTKRPQGLPSHDSDGI